MDITLKTQLVDFAEMGLLSNHTVKSLLGNGITDVFDFNMLLLSGISLTDLPCVGKKAAYEINRILILLTKDFGYVYLK